MKYLITRRKIARGTIVGVARTYSDAHKQAKKYGKKHGGTVRIYPLKKKR